MICRKDKPVYIDMEQEDNLPRYHSRKPIAVGSYDVTQTAEGTQIFSQFELDRPKQSTEEQVGIKIEAPIHPGLKAFNVNDLIDKGLFDAAEYFLGRPLTDGERARGMMSSAEYDTYMKAKKIEAADQTTNDLLAALVKQNEDKKKDAALAAAQPSPSPSPSSSSSSGPGPSPPSIAAYFAGLSPFFPASSSPDLNDQIINDLASPSVRDHIVQNQGQAVYDAMASTHPMTWASTPQFNTFYADAKYPNASPSPGPAAYSLPPAPLETWQVPPVIDPNRIYTIKAAKELLGRWKSDYPNKKIGPYSRLNASELNIFLRESRHAIIAWQKEQSKEAAAKVYSAELRSASPVHGKGVDGNAARPDTLKLIPFGRWFISRQRLDDDVVSFMRHDRMKLKGMPNKTVSTAMKVVITAFIENKPLPMDLLNPEEKEWLESAFRQSGAVVKKQPLSNLKVTKTPKQMKERLAVLFGELTEGPNNNPLVVQEFKMLLGQAALRGIITDGQIAIGHGLLHSYKDNNK